MPLRNHLSKADQRGLTALAILLILLICGVWWFSRKSNSSDNKLSRADSAQQTVRFWKAKAPAAYTAHRTGRLFRFDPNAADSATFVRLGLPYWIAGRIIHYRRAGGRFREPEDLKRIYGLKPETFQTLRPYIFISPSTSQDTHATGEKSGSYTKYEKVTPKSATAAKQDLNRTDSAALIQISGIGPYYAHRIVRYRQLLGGYTDVKQLSEIHIPEELVKWFYVTQPQIHRLQINRLPFRDLLRHPYLNYEQVKAIFRHRDKFGPIQSLQELSNEPAFTPEDLKRLTPYVSFDN